MDTMKAVSVLVTGASRGIGLEIVKEMATAQSKPSHVFATCRNPDNAKELREFADDHSSVKLIQLDVDDPVSLTKAYHIVERQLEGKGLNLLINNAGVNPRESLDEVTVEAMMSTYKTNVVGPLMVTKRFLPLLRLAAQQNSEKGLDASRAAIINISSKLGSIEYNTGGMYSYRASKAALNMVTSCLLADLEGEGILTVPLHPGHVQTRLGGEGAPVTTQQSVTGLLKVIAHLTKEQNGKLYDFTGEIIPW